MTREKRLLIASFLTLIAAGIGFGIRGAVLGEWGAEFEMTKTDLGKITGGGFTGFGVVILLSSLVADRIGYKTLLVLAFLMHLVSYGATAAATPVFAAHGKEATFDLLYWGMFAFAVGNGLCEAAINPLVATLYPKEKTHYLNILHAGWPGGIILGGLLALLFVGQDATLTHLRWEIPMAFFLVPTLIYGLLVLRESFPPSEAKAAGVDFGRMLVTCLSPLFLVLLLLHAMIGYVELGTDSWIGNIMDSALTWPGIVVLIYTAGLMFVLRFFAGPIVERINPLGLLFVSSLLGAAGLYALGLAEGSVAILVAATIYGLGKTFLWPTMLGVVGERFPQGGAIAMGLLGGVGMLSAGVLGGPGIGYTQDVHASAYLEANDAAAYERVKSADTNSFLFFPAVQGLDGAKVEALVEADPQREVVAAAGLEGGRAALRTTALVPAAMALGFLLLLLGFRMRGGYKAVELGADQGARP